MPKLPDSTTKTSALFRNLFQTPNLKQFIENNEDAMQVPALHEYLTALCAEKSVKKEDVIRRACIERTYGHQLFNGTRNPSRDKVLQLAVGFGLNVDETQKLLQTAGKSILYPKLKRDAALIYCITHRFEMIETQSMLQELSLRMLGDG